MKCKKCNNPCAKDLTVCWECLFGICGDMRNSEGI